jgi:phosphohistidine phosphatase
MPLSLFVLRHAKAEETAEGGDHERVLRGRGRKAAKLVGRALARLEAGPELVLCSSAARARETAELVLAAGGFGAPLELRGELYMAGTAQLIAELVRVGPEVHRLLLVGHQPGLSLLIGELTGGEPEFPTTALARLDFESEGWHTLAPRSGRLVWLLTSDLLAAFDGAE